MVSALLTLLPTGHANTMVVRYLDAIGNDLFRDQGSSDPLEPLNISSARAAGLSDCRVCARIELEGNRQDLLHSPRHRMVFF
jgi:hypothetical protein